MEAKSSFFYLGREFDPAAGKPGETPLRYDPADLTTHAVVTGMTGSGKTGLCITLLEEAALQGIPAIVIDVKGDLTNLLLHFPDLAPRDFEPWIDPEAARRQGKDLTTFASETAGRWQQGLAGWGLGRQQLLDLQGAVHFSVYTPGSSAGIPVNILSSFQAPDLPWQNNREILREKIASIVTALLGLIGLGDIDPLRSREHILLANILEHAWSAPDGPRPLDLTELILQTQNPPFERLGAFPVENFFPAKERFDLAMRLNNFLAAPSFQTWLEGQPLDVPALLYTPEGKPRHSIFYLAHLSEDERMFFVTLLLAAVESWMRAQRGTSGLRALVYFDEILGYLPPVANPPSRPVLLRMLKQARAFGVGLLLATQNPVDVDYKALSNAGTWFIGRLQTEQDKQRLLAGLQSAGGALDINAFDRLISGLGQRVFVLHNVHDPAPRLLQTRWTLNYLAGPLTRAQIPALNELALAAPLAPAAQPARMPAAPATPAATSRPPLEQAQAVQVAAPAAALAATTTRPAVPAGVVEYFLPNDLGVSQAIAAAGWGNRGPLEPQGFVYRPALFAQAGVHYLARRYNLEYDRRLACLIGELEGNLVGWEQNAWNTYEAAELASQPLPQARFVALPAWLGDARRLAALQKDFVEWVYRSGTIYLRANEALKVYGGPDVGVGEFRERCSQAARQGMQAELNKIQNAYEQKLLALQQKLTRQQTETQNQAEEVEQRRVEEMGTHGELVLSLFTRRKRSLSNSLAKRRLTQKAQADLEREQQELQLLEEQLAEMERLRDEALAQVQERWAGLVNQTSEVPLAPMKKDIFVELFGVAWQPYYLLRSGQQVLEAPAFQPAAR